MTRRIYNTASKDNDIYTDKVLYLLFTDIYIYWYLYLYFYLLFFLVIYFFIYFLFQNNTLIKYKRNEENQIDHSVPILEPNVCSGSSTHHKGIVVQKRVNL